MPVPFLPLSTTVFLRRTPKRACRPRTRTIFLAIARHHRTGHVPARVWEKGTLAPLCRDHAEAKPVPAAVEVRTAPQRRFATEILRPLQVSPSAVVLPLAYPFWADRGLRLTWAETPTPPSRQQSKWRLPHRPSCPVGNAVA